MGLHSKLSPSQLPRITRCPGSVQLTAGMKRDQSSVYANEGTMLHEIMEECLDLGVYELPKSIIKAYKIIPEEDNDNQELIDAVNDCLDYVFNLHQKHADAPDAYGLIETKVGLSGYSSHTGCVDLDEVYGTLDYCYVIPSKKIMYIVDWKFGKGIEVFPDSEQLKAYALGKLKNPEEAAKWRKVGIVIGQPRLYNGEAFKMEVVEPASLIKWLETDLVPSLLSARSRNPAFNPSDKACQWCEAKAVCEYRTADNLKTAQLVFAVHATLPKPDMKEVSDLLDRIPDLLKFCSDIQAYAINQLKNGVEVPEYKLVAGRSLRKWKDPQAFIDWGEANGYSEFDLSELKLLSVAKAEKKLGKKISKEDDFQDLVIKPQGKPTLAKASDKREALVFETASDKFAGFVGE